MSTLARVASTRLLVVLSSAPDGPVVRHRWLAYRGALEEADVVLEVVPWPKDVAARRHAIHRAETADGVVVSSRLLRVRDTRALRRAARRLALDFDDALPYRDSGRGARISRTRRRRFGALVRAADAVFAGNEILGDLARKAGREAVVLPTTVEVPPGPAPAEPAEGPPVFGWIGSRATLPYLEWAWIPLSAVVASGQPIRLRVVADAVPAMPPGIAVEVVPWTPDGWRRALAGIHVGLAPLPDDPWTRGKCGLKVLQTMSVGRPVVASAVGVQSEQVHHGETGLLAGDPTAFFEALLDLATDPQARGRMGRAALECVRERWSVAVWAPRVVEAVLAWLDGSGP
ncbi:MAG: glycosyltransferase [Planctomycetota bacterium]